VRIGVDLGGLAEHLQEQGAASFVIACRDGIVGHHDSSTNTLIRRLARTQAEQAAKTVSA
jgi:hypothetical protein